METDLKMYKTLVINQFGITNTEIIVGFIGNVCLHGYSAA